MDEKLYQEMKRHSDAISDLLRELIPSIKSAKVWGGEDIDIALERAVNIRTHNIAIGDKLLDQMQKD